jgi:hypothetical protein
VTVTLPANRPSNAIPMKVSVYIREHRIRRLTKASINRTYSDGTIFVLRYGTVWETLPSGTDFAHARIAAINKETALLQGKATIPEPKPRISAPGALDVLLDQYLTETESLKSHKTWLAYKLTLTDFVRSDCVPGSEQLISTIQL